MLLQYYHSNTILLQYYYSTTTVLLQYYYSTALMVLVMGLAGGGGRRTVIGEILIPRSPKSPPQDSALMVLVMGLAAGGGAKRCNRKVQLIGGGGYL